MRKEEIRKEFFKLRFRGFAYSKCKILLQSQYDYLVSTRTLKRWTALLNKGTWDLCDASRKPQTLYRKVTAEMIAGVVALRRQCGWGQDKIKQHLSYLPISATTIKRIIKEHGLTRRVKLRGKRIKWVRWQRKHPNSLWQVDHSDEQTATGHWTLSVLDDCSRYSLALVTLKNVTTDVVTAILDALIAFHGKPREILTDNGSAYGSSSKHSRFDRWCKRRGIRHIRSSIHSPTTCGKVERLFRTIDQEISFCGNNLELFRLRYNHYRPHSSLAGKTPAYVYFGQ